MPWQWHAPKYPEKMLLGRSISRAPFTNIFLLYCVMRGKSREKRGIRCIGCPKVGQIVPLTTSVLSPGVTVTVPSGARTKVAAGTVITLVTVENSPVAAL